MSTVDADSFATSRYDIVRCLGEGGMGVVYEARDRERGRTIALKTLRRLGGPAQSGEAVLRFKNEFRALQGLEHPNLVSLGELVEEHGRWYFTMELVDGTNFVDHVRPRLAGLDERRLRGALAQLSEGLCALHAAGKVHRDIKPSNVLVTDEGRVVLLDFGLVTGTGDRERSSTAHIVGTVDYMAPEQAGARPVGPEADWYSVGVMLYQSLTGQVPLAGAPLEVLVQKQTVTPPPPSSRARGVPADLEALCLELLRLDPAARPSGAAVRARLGAGAAAPPAPAPARDASLAPLFVGRALELRQLREAFTDARRHAVTAIVAGESGVGKSALVREVTARVALEEREVVVLAGRCYQREVVPFKALDGVVDALSRTMMHLPEWEAASLLPRAAALLGDVFPVLRRVRAIAEAPRTHEGRVDPQELRTRLFAALRELLGRLADRRPLVLLIDDLQWANADSLALLSELVRPPDAPRLLLVATMRAAPAPGGGTGEAPLVSLPGDVRRLALGPLPPPEALALATALLDRAAGGAAAPLARQLATEASGHPLFIHELVRHAAGHGARGAGPLRLEGVIEARVAELPPPARRVLELLAVAGTPLDQDVVARAAGLEPADFDRAAALARAANLAHSAHVRGRLALGVYHDRVRDAVLRRLDAAARQRHHRELALSLEAGDQPDPEALAVHWRGAGEPARAAGYAARAAAAAAQALAFDHAAELYRAALELHAGERADAHALQVQLADTLAKAGRGAEAARVYLEAADGYPGGALELQQRAAEQLLRSGHVDEGLAAIRRVLAAVHLPLPKTPRRALASAVVRRGLIRLRGLRCRERGEHEVAPELLRRIDVCWSMATVIGTIDTIHGLDYSGRALLLALQAGEPARLMRTLGSEAVYSTMTGPRSGRRVKLFAQTLSLARRIGSPEGHGWTAATQGMADYYLGRFPAAREHLERAETIYRDQCTGVAWELDTVRLFLLFSMMYLGRLGEMSRRVPQLVAEALDRGDLYGATNLRLSFTNLAWLVGDDPGEARRMAEAASQRWSQRGFQVQHWYDLTAQTHIDLYTGDAAGAHRRMSERWDALTRSLLPRIQLVRIEAWSLRARAALAAASAAAPGEGAALLALARRDARRIRRERLPGVARCLADLLDGGAAAAAGDPAGAGACFAAAAAAADGADMALHAAVARRRQGELQGGAAGAALVHAADAWMATQHVRQPGRWAAMLAPGSPPRAWRPRPASEPS